MSEVSLSHVWSKIFVSCCHEFKLVFVSALELCPTCGISTILFTIAGGRIELRAHEFTGS